MAEIIIQKIICSKKIKKDAPKSNRTISGKLEEVDESGMESTVYRSVWVGSRLALPLVILLGSVQVGMMEPSRLRRLPVVTE